MGGGETIVNSPAISLLGAYMAKEIKTSFNVSRDGEWIWMATDLPFCKMWLVLEKYVAGDVVLVRDFSSRSMSFFNFEISQDSDDRILERLRVLGFVEIDCGVYGTLWVVPVVEMEKLVQATATLGFRLIDCALLPSRDSIIEITQDNFADDHFEEQLSRALATACLGRFTYYSTVRTQHLQFLDSRIGHEILRLQLDEFAQEVSGGHNYKILPEYVELLINESLLDDTPYNISAIDCSINERGMVIETRYGKKLTLLDKGV